MTDINDNLAAVLKTVRRPGDFFAGGVFDLLPPGISVDGVGPLALPVLPEQAARLIAAAELAPYGRGEKTIVDTSVRRSWQIEPSRVRFSGKRWAETLEGVVARAALGLGIEDRVTAEFYKFLVYDTGGFFVSHRDTEKSPGMFATLVIALPSLATGGDILVRHGGREARLAMTSDDAAEARFAAFYADCVHEVLPVESGRRVTLVYNLKRGGKGDRPVPPNHAREEAQLMARLQAWVGNRELAPAKLVYPLEHACTSAEIAFETLKGADAAAAAVLASAAAKAECDLHLALLTIHQTGSAEYVGRGRSSRGRWSEPNDDDFEIGEIYDGTQTLSDWRRPDGAPVALGEMPVEEDEFSPSAAVEDMTPDENHFHEATGNEGATIERSYRRAALVLWPRVGFLEMIAAAGNDVSLPYLFDLVEKGDARAEARELAAAVIARWPSPETYYPHNSQADRANPASTLLRSLAALGEGDLIRRFLEDDATWKSRGLGDNAAVIEALARLAPDERVETIGNIIGRCAAADFGICINLLARAVTAWEDLNPSDLAIAARRLMVHRPHGGSPDPYRRRWMAGSDTAADMLKALVRIDAELAERSVDAMLSDPKTYAMDDVLIPALIALSKRAELSAARPVTRLRAACVAHLKARIALPLAPPADFKRDSELTCKCALCAPLARFLADPALPQWSMRAAQPDRSHVESTIKSCQCDVVTATVRKGSPHTLVVTKTQASYERRVAQRRGDVKMLAEIEAGPS